MVIDFSDLPDWRVASAYPNEGQYSPSQWAWEFLRRREDYRSDWQEIYHSIIDQAHSLPIFASYIEDSVKYGGIAAALNYAITDIPALKEKIRDASALSQHELACELCKESRIKAHPWFLPFMLDPRVALDSKVPFRIEAVISQTGPERKAETAFHHSLMNITPGSENFIDTRPFSTDNPWTHEPFQLHLSVDMRVPITVVKKRLLEEIERRYAEADGSSFMSIVKRNRDDKYHTYLRALDGHRSGASYDEIGSVLFHGQHKDDLAALRKQVKKTIESAMAETTDYWRLAHLDP